MINKIIIDSISAITPPNLLGIDRKIAYANRKYHSGWIWIGVIIGLAGVKLSGSDSMYGSASVTVINNIIIIVNPIISLIE